MAGTVDDYIAKYSAPVRARLTLVRGIIRRAAPKAEEKVSYGIPYYALDGRFLYFAAHTAHIGVYPVTAALRKELGKELAPYLSKTAKSTLRFPHDEPIPRALLARVVKVRAKENREKAALKKRA